MRINCVLLANGDKQEVVELTQHLERTLLDIGKVVVANTLAEAIKLTAVESPDVVLLELDLDDSKNLATLRAVRDKTEAAVVVIHQGEDEVLGVQAVREGADDFVFRQDLTARSLRAILLHALARRHRQSLACRVDQKLEALTTLAGV